MSLFHPIHHTFGPHVDQKYLRRARGLSYRFWAYRSGQDRLRLASALKTRFGMDAVLFSSGREALLALLTALDLPQGSDIVVQGFTCVVVPNAIHAAGLKTIYADIDPDTLNLTPETVRDVATPTTKAVICQHTFGIPSKTDELRTLCKERGWILIEDCAHILPDRNGPSDILQSSDYAICSFGRDKAISGIAGGAALSKNASVTGKLRELEKNASEVSFWNVLRLLEYPPRMKQLVRPFIGIGLAGALLKIHHLFRLFTPVVTDDEKKGQMKNELHRIPNACAALALWQLSLLERLNDHRRALVAHILRGTAKRGWKVMHGVNDSLPLQKFPMFVENAAAIRIALKKQNIHLDDGWTGCVVCPGDCDASAAGYRASCDLNAEKAAESILSLPTHPTMSIRDVDVLLKALDAHLPNS